MNVESSSVESSHALSTEGTEDDSSRVGVPTDMVDEGVGATSVVDEVQAPYVTAVELVTVIPAEHTGTQASAANLPVEDGPIVRKCGFDGCAETFPAPKTNRGGWNRKFCSKKHAILSRNVHRKTATPQRPRGRPRLIPSQIREVLRGLSPRTSANIVQAIQGTNPLVKAVSIRQALSKMTLTGKLVKEKTQDSAESFPEFHYSLSKRVTPRRHKSSTKSKREPRMPLKDAGLRRALEKFRFGPDLFNKVEEVRLAMERSTGIAIDRTAVVRAIVEAGAIVLMARIKK